MLSILFMNEFSTESSVFDDFIFRTEQLVYFAGIFRFCIGCLQSVCKSEWSIPLFLESEIGQKQLKVHYQKTM